MGSRAKFIVIAISVLIGGSYVIGCMDFESVNAEKVTTVVFRSCNSIEGVERVTTDDDVMGGNGTEDNPLSQKANGTMYDTIMAYYWILYLFVLVCSLLAIFYMASRESLDKMYDEHKRAIDTGELVALTHMHTQGFHPKIMPPQILEFS